MRNRLLMALWRVWYWTVLLLCLPILLPRDWWLKRQAAKRRPPLDQPLPRRRITGSD